MPEIQAPFPIGVRMNVRLRLVAKRWKFSLKANFRYVAFFIILVKIDINLIVQFVAPFFS